MPDGDPMTARQHRRKTDSRHRFEWIVAALGAAIVAGSLAILAYTALTEEETPPSISFGVPAVRPVAAGFLVEVMLRNDGTRTAAKLQIEGLLVEGEKIIETSQATFDYVGARSERRGGLFFANDPGKFQLQLRARGYELP